MAIHYGDQSYQDYTTPQEQPLPGQGGWGNLHGPELGGGGTGPNGMGGNAEDIANALAQQGAGYQGRTGSAGTLDPSTNTYIGGAIADQNQAAGMQGDALSLSEAIANGAQGPEVEQMRQGLMQAQNQNTALANSAVSGGAGALAHRNALSANNGLAIGEGNTQAQVEAQAQWDAANAAAQGAAQARGQSIGAQGLAQNLSSAQGKLGFEQGAQNDTMTGSYTGMANQALANQLASDTSATNSQLNAKATAAAARQAATTAATNMVIGGVVKGAEGAATGGMMSDIRAKGDIHSAGDHKMSNYGMAGARPPGMAPMGPMTTQAHQTPGMGPQLSTTLGPRGRMAPGAMGAPRPMGMPPAPGPQFGMRPPQAPLPPPGMMARPAPTAPTMAPSPQMQAAMGGPPMGAPQPQMMARPPMQPMPPQQMMQRPAPPMQPQAMNFMSDTRAKEVSSSLMAGPPNRGYGASDGRALLAGPADANRAYNPYDGFHFVQEQYPAGRITSDERTKGISSSSSVSEGTKGNPNRGSGFGSEADHFLEHLKPYTYKYKDPANEPSSEPTGGHYLGVMAQDVERVPGLGPQIVKDTPRGKQLEGGALLSAVTAGLGRLHERVGQLEGARKGGRY